MTTQTFTLTHHSRTNSSTSSNMDQSDDKEDRKREYNRLAQREFRRRRKEHLKNLEQAQKEQNSEQSEEIERLRYENDELKRENEALRAQLYGTSSSNSGLLSAPLTSMSYDNRAYSLSPSASGASVSSSPPHLSMASLSMTSGMMNPSMQVYDTSASVSQQYSYNPNSMVHPSGVHNTSISSPESSGFRTPRSLGPTLQSIDNSLDSRPPRDASQRRLSGTSSILTPYSRTTAQSQLNSLFQQYYSDPSLATRPERHLVALQSMSATLPPRLEANQSATRITSLLPELI